MQVLYELDSSGHDLDITLERTIEDAALKPEPAALTRVLVQGVRAHCDELDAVIREHARQWPVEQLSAVDRNILRIAIFEIVFNNKTPPKAAINEAVELAKIFGSENLYRFVNGVLGSVLATAQA